MNTVAIFYLSQSFVVSFFTVFAQSTEKSKDCGIAIFGGTFIVCVINYFVNGRWSLVRENV